MEIPQELLPEGFTQHHGMPICPCGHKTEPDGDFPCEHNNPLTELGLI